MGYFLDGSGDYYEGEKRDPSDTTVTQRPADYYDWGGSAWALNLARTQTFQKGVIIQAAADNAKSLLSGDEDVAESNLDLMMMAIAMICSEGEAYAEDVTHDVPFWDGYIAENTTNATLANLNTNVYPVFKAIATLMGRIVGQAIQLIENINADTVAADVLTETWTTIS